MKNCLASSFSSSSFCPSSASSCPSYACVCACVCASSCCSKNASSNSNYSHSSSPCFRPPHSYRTYSSSSVCMTATSTPQMRWQPIPPTSRSYSNCSSPCPQLPPRHQHRLLRRHRLALLTGCRCRISCLANRLDPTLSNLTHSLPLLPCIHPASLSPRHCLGSGLLLGMNSFYIFRK